VAVTIFFKVTSKKEVEMTTTTTTDSSLENPPTRLDPIGRSLLFTDARSVNSFAPTPVSDAELAEIWELAKWGPSAANTQPLRVVYVRTPDGKERLLKNMAEGNVAKTTAAPVTAILAFDSEFHEFIPQLLPFRPELREVFAGNAELSESTGRFNATLQAGYFIVSVRAHGLAAGPMAGFDAPGMDAEFFPDGRWKSLLVVNIGHPGENPWMDRLPRLDHPEVVQWA
jgi:3-hydroxypropanoate dehydrogenase